MRYVIFGILIVILAPIFFTENEPARGYQVIPDEAIRLRILANSNSDADQAVKREVRDRVNAEITNWVEDLTSIEEARQVIQSRLDEIRAIVKDTVGEQTFQVDYGMVEFPDKIYDNYVYPAGTYEAILITIGEGEGENWWCVLFPPLCFVDFANGATVLDHDNEDDSDSKEDEDVKVSFFLWEWIKKIFHI